MTIKFVSTEDTANLRGQSYHVEVLTECFDTLMPDSGLNTQYLSKGKQKKIEDLLAEQYVILYCVESYSYPVKDYHDADGDYINSDSETTPYLAPTDAMMSSLVEMGYSKAQAFDMLASACKTSHYVNLYYGESIRLLSFAIKI